MSRPTSHPHIPGKGFEVAAVKLVIDRVNVIGRRGGSKEDESEGGETEEHRGPKPTRGLSMTFITVTDIILDIFM